MFYLNKYLGLEILSSGIKQLKMNQHFSLKTQFQISLTHQQLEQHQQTHKTTTTTTLVWN